MDYVKKVARDYFEVVHSMCADVCTLHTLHMYEATYVE